MRDLKTLYTLLLEAMIEDDSLHSREGICWEIVNLYSISYVERQALLQNLRTFHTPYWASSLEFLVA